MTDIQKNVPIPPGRVGRPGRWPQIQKLEVGDCITVKWHLGEALRAAANGYGRARGWRFTTRADQSKDEFTLWRIA